MSDEESSSEDEVEVPKKAPVKRKKKEQTGPKKPLSAYMFFCKDQRADLKEANPELSFGELGKKMGTVWKEMKAKEKKQYQDQADDDKQRYKDEGGGPAGGGKKKKTGPKRPLSAYMFFSKEQQPIMKSENPELKFSEIGKAVGAAWQEVAAEDRGVYNKLAAKDKKRYQAELAEAEEKKKEAEEEAAAEEEAEESGTDDDKSDSD